MSFKKHVHLTASQGNMDGPLTLTLHHLTPLTCQPHPAPIFGFITSSATICSLSVFETHEALSCLKASLVALPSAWNTFPGFLYNWFQYDNTSLERTLLTFPAKISSTCWFLFWPVYCPSLYTAPVQGLVWLFTSLLPAPRIPNKSSNVC